jgi:hypothetical protein
MRINPAKVQELRTSERTQGLDAFLTTLGPIHLPSNAGHQPDREMIRQGNIIRKIRTD